MLRSDRRRVNLGVQRLVDEGLKEQWFQHTRLELCLTKEADGPPIFPSVETDRSPALAASRYHVYAASAELVESLLVHDDSELQAEAIADGDAFRGRIARVRDLGRGRVTRPVWWIEDRANHQLRLRTGSRVCVVGFPERTGAIQSISETDDGALLLEVEITGRKTARGASPAGHELAPNDPRWVGEEIAFVDAPGDSISRTKSFRVWQRDVPGAWLTHMRPGGTLARVDEEDTDDIAGEEVLQT